MQYFRFMAYNLNQYVRNTRILDGVTDIACTCGSTQKEIIEEPVKLEIEGKGQSPDILGSGEYPYTIVSQRFVDMLEENHIEGYRLAKASLYDKKMNLRSKDYYILIITNFVELDLEAMGVKKIYSGCPKCGSRIMYNKNKWEWGKAKWKTELKGDLLKYKGGSMSTFCSKRMIELIIEHKLNNFCFEKAEDVFTYPSNSYSPKNMLKLLRAEEKEAKKQS